MCLHSVEQSFTLMRKRELSKPKSYILDTPSKYLLFFEVHLKKLQQIMFNF